MPPRSQFPCTRRRWRGRRQGAFKVRFDKSRHPLRRGRQIPFFLCLVAAQRTVRIFFPFPVAVAALRLVLAVNAQANSILRAVILEKSVELAGPPLQCAGTRFKRLSPANSGRWAASDCHLNEHSYLHVRLSVSCYRLRSRRHGGHVPRQRQRPNHVFRIVWLFYVLLAGDGF